MLSTRLLRAQLQLRSHRTWLASFVARTGLVSSATPKYPDRLSSSRHGDVRFITQKATIRKSNEKSPWHGFRKVKLKQERRTDESQARLEVLQQAVQDADISRVAKLYDDVGDKSVVGQKDLRALAQFLYHSLTQAERLQDPEAKRARIEELVAFAEKLTADIVGGKVTPSTPAHAHLLRFYQASGLRDTGVRFWQWLEQQDDSYVSADVCGAAIELLAVNGVPLAEVETLYMHALERFPGSFSAYHLSPNAIVPDRNQRTILQDIPIGLVFGILAARLLHGDPHNAYLALDTVLRLYPDQVSSRFFAAFLDERPVAEAYTLFAVACRGGIVLSMTQFRNLLGQLRTSSDLSSPSRHALAVRSMLSATYMYMGAGRKVMSNNLSELIIAVTQLLRVKGVVNLEAKEKQDLVTPVMDIIRKLFVVLARYGVRPGRSAFNSIITNLGGFGQSRKVIDVAVADMQRLGLQPNEVTRRSILTSAGLLGDGEYVREAWQELLQARAEVGQQPDATDLHVLIKNAALTGQLEFAASEFETFRSSIPEEDHSSLEEALEPEIAEVVPETALQQVDVSTLLAEIRNIANDILIIDRKTQQNPSVQGFSHQPLPMTLLGDTAGIQLPENESRALYDSLTAEPGKSQEGGEIGQVITPLDPAFDVESESFDMTRENDSEPKIHGDVAIDNPKSNARSLTGLSLGHLRYENWKTMNYLLELAKKSDEAYLKIVDDAIAAGTVPPQRTLGLTLANHDGLRSYGLSDALRVTQEMRQESAEMSDVEIQAKKDEILRLRGRLS